MFGLMVFFFFFSSFVMEYLFVMEYSFRFVYLFGSSYTTQFLIHC